ncbi:MAG: beta-N-acetylhexosaminidase [Rhizobiaceae bacterium]
MDLSETGNHVFLGLQPFPRLQDKDKYLLDAVKPAGVILFKSNFLHDVNYEVWLDNHRQFVAEIRETVGRQKLIIATDHEGGRVCRTPAPITRFKSACDWAEHAGEIGTAMGTELASIGLNMNFAPVMDIHTNPENPVIGARSFGSTPERVSKSGAALIKGLHSENVWACAKHFPGHGDTDVDSHYALPRVDLALEEIDQRELVPFRAAIEQGIRVIMTSHILFPQIDPDYPATLSHAITTGLLRRKLGYDGVIVSDDIGMHAMDRYFDKSQAARQFLEAGNDMLMICAHFTDTERIIELAGAMREAMKDDHFREHVHEPSKKRVQKLLEDTIMPDVVSLPKAIFDKHASIAGVFGDQTAEVM